MKQSSFLAVLMLGFLAVSLQAGDGGCPCSSDLSVTVSRGAASRATTNITQTEFMFTAKTVTINVGDTVTWTNNGTIAHTSTSDTGVWDSSAMNPGQSFSFTFTSAGTFPFHCSFHQSLGMVGTVTVNAVNPNPNPNPNPTPSGTPTTPTAPTTNTATVQFRVKSSDTNGSLSKLTEKIDVSSLASQLPKSRSGKPTLVGLSNIYLFVGSAVFTGTIDVKGKTTGPFSAKISGTGLLTIQAKGLNLVSLLGLTLTADGTFTVPNQTAVIVASTSAQTTLFSGFAGTATVSYTVKKGTATAK